MQSSYDLKATREVSTVFVDDLVSMLLVLEQVPEDNIIELDDPYNFTSFHLAAGFLPVITHPKTVSYISSTYGYQAEEKLSNWCDDLEDPTDILHKVFDAEKNSSKDFFKKLLEKEIEYDVNKEVMPTVLTNLQNNKANLISENLYSRFKFSFRLAPQARQCWIGLINKKLKPDHFYELKLLASLLPSGLATRLTTFLKSPESETLKNGLTKLFKNSKTTIFELFFRGETRTPDVIFKKGFQPQEPRYGHAIELRGLFDSQADHCVALTRRLDAAAAFPCTMSPSKKSWIYVVVSGVSDNPKEGLNVNCRSLSLVTNSGELLNSAWASEYAVPFVKPEHILCAIPIERSHEAENGLPGYKPFCAFKITGKPIKNAERNVSDLNILKKYQKLIRYVNEHLKQFFTIPWVTSYPISTWYDQLLRGDFFIGNRYQIKDLQLVKGPEKKQEHKGLGPKNDAFFAQYYQLRSTGIIFPSKGQLEKENELLYRHSNHPQFKERLSAENASSCSFSRLVGMFNLKPERLSSPDKPLTEDDQKTQEIKHAIILASVLQTQNLFLYRSDDIHDSTKIIAAIMGYCYSYFNFAEIIPEPSEYVKMKDNEKDLLKRKDF